MAKFEKKLVMCNNYCSNTVTRMNTVRKSIADSKSTVSIYHKEKIIFQKKSKIPT